MQSGNANRSRPRQIVTLAARIIFFALTLAPLGALLMPWVTLDGTGKVHTGIETISLPASAISAYLYDVNPLQAAILIVGTAMVALLAMLTTYYYQRRRSIYWTPPAILALTIAVAFGTGDLVNATHGGLSLAMAVAVLLILHQTVIRVRVFLSHKGKLPKVRRALSVAAGIG